MIKMPFDDMVRRINEATNISEDEIRDKVKKKMEQLSGLISKEGAAHIVANELGIRLFDIGGRKKIKEMLPGMRNITIVGKVEQIFESREFSVGARQGRVANIVIGDETGTMRVVLWNDQVDSINKLAKDITVKIDNGYVRDNNGRTEIHLNDKSRMMINPEGEKVGEVKRTPSGERKKINELKENDQNIEILGTVVQLFEPRFFEICPSCGKRAKPVETNFVCESHGNVSPDYSYVLNLFLDDGTENIRVVCFRNQAEALLKKTKEEMVSFKTKPEEFESMKNELLGNMIKFTGRVVKNQMFDRLEFIANNVVTDLNPDEEIAKLNEELQKVEAVK
ncbi:DUF2240 family protein [Candidatus Woesearchaeota archaeon]|nr:DUF2240 family protein [Candidatus Woesearchaeota archaeon]